MEKIKLIEPTIEYEKDIWDFRQEILDSDDNDKFAGCGTLERCISASEWIENCKSKSNKDTCPSDKVPSNVFIAVRISDNKAIEVDIGIGTGIGGNLSEKLTAQSSRASYVGIDDGVVVTGNNITNKFSLFGYGIGDKFNHLVEKDGNRVSSSGSNNDGPLDMIAYPDVEWTRNASLGNLEFNSDAELLFSKSYAFYLGLGGEINLAFNITEFVQELFN